MIATMWTTVKTVENCTCARDKCYLVQNLETDFYTEGNALRIQGQPILYAQYEYAFFNNLKMVPELATGKIREKGAVCAQWNRRK